MRVSAILPQIQNGGGDKLSRGFLYMRQQLQVHLNFKLIKMLEITALPAIFSKILNGAFVYIK